MMMYSHYFVFFTTYSYYSLDVLRIHLHIYDVNDMYEDLVKVFHTYIISSSTPSFLLSCCW